MAYEIGSVSSVAPAASTGNFAASQAPPPGGLLAAGAKTASTGRSAVAPGAAELDALRRSRAAQQSVVARLTRAWVQARKAEAEARATARKQKHFAEKDKKLALKLAKAIAMAAKATQAALLSQIRAKQAVKALDDQIRALVAKLPAIPPPSPATTKVEQQAQAETKQAQAEVAQVQSQDMSVPTSVSAAGQEAGTPVAASSETPSAPPAPVVAVAEGPAGDVDVDAPGVSSGPPMGMVAAAAVVGGFVLWKMMKR